MRIATTTDGSQTPGSHGKPQSSVDPQPASGQAPSDNTPDTDQVVPTENEEHVSDEPRMDISPIHTEDERFEMDQPVSQSEAQPDVSTKTNIQPINAVPDYPAEHVAGGEPFAQAIASDALVSHSGQQEDQDSGDSDVSMQTSSPESSSDDESYEPQPAQISDNQGALPEERKVHPNMSAFRIAPATNQTHDEQIVDTDPSEPSPVQTDVRSTQPSLEDANGEVVLGPSL